MSLFRRLKKRTDDLPSERPEREETQPKDTPQDTEALRRRLSVLQNGLDTATDDDERIQLLNSIGGLHQKLGEPLAAIDIFESSMDIREQYGPAYNALLTLYNDQLSSAARAKDDAGIQEWTGKLDQLMALSKRVMRSNY